MSRMKDHLIDLTEQAIARARHPSGELGIGIVRTGTEGHAIVATVIPGCDVAHIRHIPDGYSYAYPLSEPA
jgi:hypothetical protein